MMVDHDHGDCVYDIDDSLLCLLLFVELIPSTTDIDCSNSETHVFNRRLYWSIPRPIPARPLPYLNTTSPTRNRRESHSSKHKALRNNTDSSWYPIPESHSVSTPKDPKFCFSAFAVFHHLQTIGPLHSISCMSTHLDRVSNCNCDRLDIVSVSSSSVRTPIAVLKPRLGSLGRLLRCPALHDKFRSARTSTASERLFKLKRFGEQCP